MSVLAFLVAPAALGILVWHLVKPAVRDLRISMARFLPDFEPSRAPKVRVSLVPPVGSVPFWLRVVLIALISIALWPQFLPPLERDTSGQRVRVIVDRSPSMQVGERLDLARDAARAVGDFVASMQEACLETVLVDGVSMTLVDGASDTGFAAPVRADQGMPASALLRALMPILSAGCDGPPTRAVIVTDLPPQSVAADLFGGAVIWWQVGEPAANLAIADVRVTGGGISDDDPRLEVLVSAFGWEGDAPRVAIANGGQSDEITLRADPHRAGGWSGALPYLGDGETDLWLMSQDALASDDRLRVDVPVLDALAVDWALNALPRPAAFVPGGADDLRVQEYQANMVVPGDRPVVLGYGGWGASQAGQVAFFQHQHPVLNGVNFDVLERHMPQGLDRLPPGFVPVLRADGPGSPVIVAIRAVPRGVIVPLPVNGGPARDLSRLLFANALRWTAAQNDQRALDPRHVTARGVTVRNALMESDTARPAAPAPDLSVLNDPAEASVRDPRTEPSVWVPWLLVAALLVFLAERGFGLIWRRPT